MAIDHVNLGRLDLNLLVSLDALLTELSERGGDARRLVGAGRDDHLGSRRQ